MVTGMFCMNTGTVNRVTLIVCGRWIRDVGRLPRQEASAATFIARRGCGPFSLGIPATFRTMPDWCSSSEEVPSAWARAGSGRPREGRSNDRPDMAN